MPSAPTNTHIRIGRRELFLHSIKPTRAKHVIYNMKQLALFLMLFLCTAAGWAQGLVKGKVLDKRNSEPLSFVNVKVSQTATGKFVSGGMTDSVGNFNIQ